MSETEAQYETEEKSKVSKSKKIKKSTETPNYDKKSAEVRKYIIGGAAKFIPDLCEALKQDWYPHTTHEEISKELDLKREIKRRVVNDWCKETSEDGEGWSRETIGRFWPEWVEEPHSHETARERQSYQEYRNFMTSVHKKDPQFVNLTNVIPTVPVQQDEDEEEAVPHTQRQDTPVEIYDDSMNAIGRLWHRLFNYKDLPGPKTDIESVILAPSRDYRLRLLKGLGTEEKAALITQVQQMHQAYIGFLKQARDILAEERRVEK